MSVYVGEATDKPYRVSWDCCIWVCYSCGEMFDSELCWSFTGECYECYPRPDKMKVKE
jgi:hypothetical protein